MIAIDLGEILAVLRLFFGRGQKNVFWDFALNCGQGSLSISKMEFFIKADI